MPSSPPTVALVYDRVNTRYGGAENILLALHELFPKAPLFTALHDAQAAQWANSFQVKPSFLQKIPWAKQRHRLLAALMPIAFESHNLKNFDIIISVTSAEAKGILSLPQQLHICYLLTPTRYLWSHRDEYQADWLTGWLRQLVFKYLQWWDTAAALRPDALIPISKLVKQRCEEYYQRQTAEVIYPPVSLQIDKTSELPQRLKALAIQKNEFYLIIARIVPYKRIDLAIEVCQREGWNLVVVGAGPDLKRLQKLASKARSVSKVIFTEAVQLGDIGGYYTSCKAFLAPGEEDFGITAIEAQAYGKPVIIFGKSGAAELIEDGQHGVHFLAQTPESLSQAIKRSQTIRWDIEAIQQNSAKYTKKQFQAQFKQAVERAWKERKL